MRRLKPKISVREVRDYVRTGGALQQTDRAFCETVLESGSQRARLFLAAFIHFHPSEEGRQILQRMLDDEEAGIQVAAATYLRGYDAPELYGLMLKKAKSPDFEIRGAAMMTAQCHPLARVEDIREFFLCEPNKYGKLIACYGMLRQGYEVPYLKFVRTCLRSASLLQKQTALSLYDALLTPARAQLFYDDVSEVISRQDDFHLVRQMENFLIRLEEDPALKIRPKPWHYGEKALDEIERKSAGPGAEYYLSCLRRQLQAGRTGDQRERMLSLIGKIGAKMTEEAPPSGRCRPGEAETSEEAEKRSEACTQAEED